MFGMVETNQDFYALGGGSVLAVRVTRSLRAVLHGGGGGQKWAEGISDWRSPAGDASLFLAPERAGDAECHFGLCDGGPFAPCALLERPILSHYAEFLARAGVRTSPATSDVERDELEGGMVESSQHDKSSRALEHAIRAQRETLAHALLVAGASATGGLGPREAGMTPLHWAAAKCSSNMVQLLVKFAANVMHPTATHASPGHVACAAGNYSALQSLLAARAHAQSRDSSKQSLLHYAVRSGNLETVELAANAKAEINCRDQQLRTALHWAALGGDSSICRLLLALRASCTPPKVPQALHRRRTRLAQESPLELALSRHPSNAELHAIFGEEKIQVPASHW